MCLYLGGRGTLPEPAELAAPPAAAAAEASASSPPLRWCSAEASVALLAGFALEAASAVAVGPSSERGKPEGPEQWPGWTGRCGGLKRSEIERAEVEVGGMKKPGEGRRGVRRCHNCSLGRRD